MPENAPATEPAAELTNRARLMRVLRNPQVRKVQLAFVGSTLGDWAFATAIVVWAYQEGGAGAVGAYQAVRFVSMTVAGPVGGVIADRVSRKTFMIVSDASRAVLVSAAAITLAVDGPALVVYALAIIAALVGSPFRAAQAGLLPELVESPSDLTAANALAGNLESVMIFAGPAVAGLMIAQWDVQVVFWLNVATFAWSILLLLGIKTRADAASTEADEEPPEDSAGFWSDLTGGFGLVVRDRDLRNVALLSGANGFAWGGLTVFMVLLATDVLDSGPEGLGYLNSVLGVATVVGGLAILTRLSGSRLGEDMIMGAFGWGLPLLALAAFPSPVTVVAALAVIGLTEPLYALGSETIPQRVAPADTISRVYTVIDVSLVAPMALSSLLAPWLVDELGLRAAIAIAGGLVVVVALSRWSQMRDFDRRHAPPPALDLLHDVPVFAELPASALERLARSSERVQVPSGSVVLTEGDSSDRFFVIASGAVEVTQGGRLLRTEGPGEFFGEIGLLRDVPRTATVTAAADCEFLVVERADFLAAVSQLGEAMNGLEDIVVRRLYS
ncbi:MFS transporter [Aeromicrobium sp. 9AM]|uniref:MFS transporter n=1 Tax=Aeromicrobium sp. 9AM TaxID=2653126 RepID=UPI0012F10905|nr:MFS transporter [Aeromicrobium sp. 9AM]VXB10377.1 conserved membrane hypothetical protein [Aeromicrobium sp. 9AM]